MGLFDSLGSLIKATVDTALVPVAIIKDTGDFITCDDQKESHTKKQVKKVGKDLEDAYDEL